MKTKHSIRTILSGFLTAVMLIGTFPSITVNAAQINEYVDPADGNTRNSLLLCLSKGYGQSYLSCARIYQIRQHSIKQRCNVL